MGYRWSGKDAYQFIDIPTPMLTSDQGVGHSVSRLEVPVQVSRFSPFAFFVGMEASSALTAWLAKFLVEAGYEMGSGSD